jgi:hypothetical protein
VKSGRRTVELKNELNTGSNDGTTGINLTAAASAKMLFAQSNRLKPSYLIASSKSSALLRIPLRKVADERRHRFDGQLLTVQP